MIMREWQVGDPIGDGNDLGVPDIEYLDYLRDKSDDDEPYERGGSSYSSGKRTYSYDECIENAKRLSGKGKYMEAIVYYDLALDMVYHDEVALNGKAECLCKIGAVYEASQCYSDLGFKYTFSRGEEEIAIRYYKKCLELNPDNDEALDYLGYSLKELERYSEALTYYKRVKTKDVDLEMAWCYMGLKEYELAIPLLDKKLKESPHADDWLDHKCECLIELDRKSEAIACYKQFIDMLMDEECYERALERLDLLSKTIPDDPFIEERRERCINDKVSLEIRLQAVLNAIASHHMYNPKGLDENDLRGFIEYVSEKSGESIEDILRWYTTPMLDSFNFYGKCNEMLHYPHWTRILEMYGMY